MLSALPNHGLPFVALGVCAVAAGCGPGGEAARPLAVLVSGDTAGWIVPCGCASNQSGGLPRRASAVEPLRADRDVIVADAGGAPKGSSPYDRLKFEAVLRGELAMDLAAHNLGGSEAALGPDYLRDVAARLAVPFVSANAADSAGKPLAEPLRIVAAGGRRVALVGVLSPRYATPQVCVRPPRHAVLDALAAHRGRYDAVIVLAYLPQDELRALAETLPEADAVVGGPTLQPLVPEAVGPTVLASATNQGKFLVRLDAPQKGGSERWTATVVELNEQYADDPGQVENLRAYYAELARADFAPADTSLVRSLVTGQDGARIAGTKSCRKCHQEDAKLWDDSKHAKAWESLAAKGTHVDPDCQRCHATGYGLAGGFVSAQRSPRRVNVGCEDCHGPSAAHAAQPKVRTPYYQKAIDTCTGCHDRENSPKFDRQAYWEKIRHGLVKGEDVQGNGDREAEGVE